MSRVVVIIDGSNVARCTPWRSRSGADADHDLRRALVDAVAGWIGASSDADEAQLVFDGAGPWVAGVTAITPVVSVIGSGSRTGDSVVEQRASELARRGTDYWIVSSDREVRAVAGARALRVVAADAFVAMLAGTADATREHRAAAPQPTGLGGLLADDVRSKLERLRRGE